MPENMILCKKHIPIFYKKEIQKMNQQPVIPRKEEIDFPGLQRLKADIQRAEEDLARIRAEIKSTKDTEGNILESPSFLYLVATERAKKSELDDLYYRLQNSEVVDKAESFDEAVIGFGDTAIVEIQYAGGDIEEETYKIVSSSPDSERNELTPKSPIGRAIYRKKVGDITTFKLPNGCNATLKIISMK